MIQETGYEIIEIFSHKELCGSRTQAKKMLTQGGLYVWDEGDWFKIPDDSVHVIFSEDTIFRAGKKKFLKLVF